MKQRLSSPRHRTIMPLITVAALAAIVIIVAINRGYAGDFPSTKSAVNTSVPSQFSFTGAAGWHKGPTNETSMALFSDDRSCFTSIEHKTGTIDVVATLQKQQNNLAASGGTMTPGAILTVTVRTGTGQKQYELHQYSLSSGSSEKLMGGLQLGYAQLSSGYLEIQGHCNTVDQLPSTVSALQAYKFDM